MKRRYVVVFEECGGFSAGAVITGSQVATEMAALDYLLGIGAIVPFRPYGLSVRAAAESMGSASTERHVAPHKPAPAGAVAPEGG